MSNLVPSSIRSKLVLLGLLASLPIVLLMLFNSWYQRQVEVERATERMQRILHLAVLHEEEIIRGTHRLMAALAEAPAVRESGSRCSGFLARILKNSPGYLNFGTIRPDGRIACSAVPLRSPVNAYNLPHFQGALRNRSFSMGRYILGRITGKPIVPFGYPVIDRDGRVSSVLFASLDLSRQTKFEAEIDVQTPGDSIYLKIDGSGTVLSSYLASTLYPAGRPIKRSLFEKVLKEKNGTFRDAGEDGIERLYLFSAFRGQFFERGGFALLGIPAKALFAEHNRLLATNLSVLAVVGGIFFAVIWFGGNALIVRPVRILTDASNRMAAGDLAARSGLSSSRGELGRLGAAFDEMAERIQQGQAESLRMQEALRAAAATAENEKAKSEAIIAGIGDGISIVDRDFRITYQNRVHKERMGDHAGELCFKAYHGRDATCDGCAVAHSFRTGRIHVGEIERMVNGRQSINELTASPLKDASGQIVAGIEVVRDITERRETERRISRSLRMLSALHKVDLNILRGVDLEETLGVMCDAVIRMGHRICWVGLTGRDHTTRIVVARGTSRESIEAMDIRWDETPRGTGPFGTVVKTGRTYVCRDILEDARLDPWKDRLIEFGLRSLVSLPLKSDDGKVVGALVVYSDREDAFPSPDVNDLETFAQQSAVAVLSAKWIENLRDANQRLTFHVNRMPLGYIVWNTDFSVSEWNPAAERIFGWKMEEVNGMRSFDFLVPEEEKPAVEKNWARLMEGEETHSSNWNLRKDGRRIMCEWFNNPLQDRSGDIIGVLSMVNDVTDKYLLEKQLQIAQRMEAVGTLAGGVAHDFNNALTGIFGFSEMLRPHLKGNERALSHLNEVMRSAERASTLTRQLLTYSRRQPISPANLSLNDVVSDLLKLVSKVVGEHIEIRMALAENLPTIQADSGQIEQVLMNLVINARDAMPDGGRLVIQTGEAHLDEEYVRYHPHMNVGSYVVLTVSDTGVGMDAKTQERVFDPFFTTKGPSKGTGLGLAMVYGIVKQHNGFIHLYSEPGRGTTFKIYLPPVTVAPDMAVPAKPPELRGGTETILLAEDDESVRALMEDTLKNLGYTVLAARNGREAVDVFERNRENVSLALLDVAMPVMGGKEAFEAMYKVSPGLKVVFMSGYAADGAHETFLLITGAPFLPKPFGPAELGRKVREVLDGK